MPFEPENELEHSLLLAANDPAHRPQFYQDFAKSLVFAITAGPGPDEPKERVTKSDEQFNLVTWERDGQSVIPMFSSLRRLEAAVSEPASYIALNAIEFLRMTRGMPLVLNPAQEVGKEFTVAEIEAILDGSIGKPSETRTIRSGTQVLVGQPKNYPHELVGALTRYFQTNRSVRKAKMGHVFIAGQDESAHTLIAIDAGADFDKVLPSALIITKEVYLPDPPVDIVRWDRNWETLLKDITPFYRKKFLGIF